MTKITETAPSKVRYHYPTVASKCFAYQFLATLYERGQGIPIVGDKRG